MSLNQHVAATNDAAGAGLDGMPASSHTVRQQLNCLPYQPSGRDQVCMAAAGVLRPPDSGCSRRAMSRNAHHGLSLTGKTCYLSWKAKIWHQSCHFAALNVIRQNCFFFFF